MAKKKASRKKATTPRKKAGRKKATTKRRRRASPEPDPETGKIPGGCTGAGFRPGPDPRRNLLGNKAGRRKTIRTRIETAFGRPAEFYRFARRLLVDHEIVSEDEFSGYDLGEALIVASVYHAMAGRAPSLFRFLVTFAEGNVPEAARLSDDDDREPHRWTDDELIAYLGERFDGSFEIEGDPKKT